VITPFYVGVDSIATPYHTGFSDKFDQQSAWWAFNFVANWAALKYSYIISDIEEKQKQLELEAMESTREMEKEALALYTKDPEKTRDMLTTFSQTRAESVVSEWWAFAWRLVAKYSDGYVNEPGKMAQEVGYPESWYDRAEWKNGPTTYGQPQILQPGD